MNHLTFQNQRHSSTNHNPCKKRLTKDQVRRLEISFNSNNHLDPDRKLQLTRELAIPPRQIAIWYQNRRARCKIQNLQLNYRALRLKLEAVLVENRRLEREVERLERELKKSHNFFSRHHLGCGNNDNNGSRSSEQEVGLNTCSWVDNEDLQLEEVYNCLMWPQIACPD